MTKYLDLPIGEIVTDHLGIEWKRTNHRDISSVYEDNYYYMPMKCFCDVEVGGGYTHRDEWGPCDHCDSLIRQINSHNDDVKVDFDNENLFDKTKK